MPTYVYKFVDSGETVEVVQAFDDDTLTELAHPSDGVPRQVKKVFQPVGVTFKGSGFYKTDSRGGGKNGSSTTPASTESSSSTEGSSSSSSSDSGASSDSGSSSSTSAASATPASAPAPAATPKPASTPSKSD
jgi:predicted nucleic acid-binding Zn ribbon protein